MTQETTSTSTNNNHPRMRIADIIIGQRHRQDLGDIAALAKSIRDVGLLHPVVVTKDNRLIAGRRRLEAVKDLGWDEVPVHVVEGFDDAISALRAERDENECRKPFSPSEAVAIGKALQELEKPKAAMRKREGAKKGGRAKRRKEAAKPNEPPGNLPGASPETTNGLSPNEPTASEPETPEPERRVRDEVAQAVGMSGRTLEKAQAVVDAAEENPEQFGPIKEEMDKTGKVDPAFKKVRQRRQPRVRPKSSRDKSAGAGEQSGEKKGKQHRDKKEVHSSWQKQPNESSQEWFDRLKAVKDKDKTGLKREFEAIKDKAERFSIFKIDEELFEIAHYLIRHRDRYWPPEFRPQFGDIIRSAAEFADKTEGELYEAFYPEDGSKE
jgi:ParB-like chromosome segregation protein Spo0J